ncbi:NUDIX hydrolase [Phenylobacterium sp.]|uniref:NUDIX hydrolase n=1 Tax=Phenylobacterium sp. TaxID=1871053 RepID=UPI0019BB2CF0|nr:NUDIX hydrolase [Phenylobacterium sp.]MBC7166399.1 NUDIX hydrolase [Phenylobacterium sp.]
MLRRFFDWWRGADLAEPEGPVTPQSGAVPYRMTDKGVRFLLVTSRRTGRWLFPKGGLMPGLEAWDSAAREALEEAGVEGVVSCEALGAYRSARVRDERSQTIEVTLYPLEVTRQLDRWPEKAQRRRRWADIDEACAMVRDPDLIAILETAQARIAAQGAASGKAKKVRAKA